MLYLLYLIEQLRSLPVLLPKPLFLPVLPVLSLLQVQLLLRDHSDYICQHS